MANTKKTATKKSSGKHVNSANAKKTSTTKRTTTPKKEIRETKKVEDEVVNDVKNEEEENKKMKEEFFEEKKDKKSLFDRIMNVILWILLFVWMGICLIDFYKVHVDKDPMFCIKKETTKYEDGTVDSCLGLGYKIYNYKRTSFMGVEYGPFWSKDRSVEATKESNE